jgi:hypothetical protein
MAAVGFQLLHLTAGAGLALAAWLVPRHVAGARWASPHVLLLDAAPVVLGAGLLGLASGRPIFAGIIALALGAGFALADYTMRQTLREPAVFSESVELPQVFTHPHLYLPFAGPGLVLGGAATAIAFAVALLVFEPPLWQPRPLVALTAAALIFAGFWLFAHEPLLGRAAAALRRSRPSGEPFADAAALGPFAMLFVHTVIARAERAARQAAFGVMTEEECHSGALAQRGNPEAINTSLWNMDSGFRPMGGPGMTRAVWKHCQSSRVSARRNCGRVMSSVSFSNTTSTRRPTLASVYSASKRLPAIKAPGASSSSTTMLA